METTNKRKRNAVVATLTQRDHERNARMGTMLLTKAWIDRQDDAIADDWFRAWSVPFGFAIGRPRVKR